MEKRENGHVAKVLSFATAFLKTVLSHLALSQKSVA